MVNQNNCGKVDFDGSTKDFTIAGNANIFSILSSKLYEMPEKAIVREVCSNAIDANIEAGKIGGIQVHLPTVDEQEFSVQDFGVGMDDQKIMEVYTQYGNSTKSNDNSQIGGFGIGAKTPFAYTDQFSIESCKDGVKNSYVAFMDETGIPKISKVMTESCDVSGTRVSFPVNSGDIKKFVDAAVEVFMFSKEMPNINAEAVDAFLKSANTAKYYGQQKLKAISSIDDFKKFREVNKTSNFVEGIQLYERDSIHLEMGGVIYDVSPEFLEKGTFNLYKFQKNTNDALPFLLHMPIGSVSVQASREKLHYTKATISKLRQAMLGLIESCLTEANDTIVSPIATFEEKVSARLRYNLDNIKALIEDIGEAA